MALVAVFAVIVFGACYDPSLRECTVSCASADDCAPDQVCGSDGLCASAAHAGHCAALALPDASPDGRDDHTDASDGDPPADARVDARVDAAPPDAPQLGAIHVAITGRGRVLLSATDYCESPNANGIACDLAAPQGPQTLHQMTTHAGDKFKAWSGACTGTGGDCHVFVVIGTTVWVGAEFTEDK